MSPISGGETVILVFLFCFVCSDEEQNKGSDSSTHQAAGASGELCEWKPQPFCIVDDPLFR